MEMDAAALRQVCKERKLYLTPLLNERLYANFRGFTSIGGLEEYTALKALFLEGNAIESLAGLPALADLKCLFLQNNRLTALDTSIARLPSLDTLNVSGNQLTRLDNLACCTALRTLVCSDNRLEGAESVAHLAECPGLETLDLQNNKLADPGTLLELLRRLPNLKSLYLQGNPMVATMHNYRKSVIAATATLTYLDDRPVFEDDRRCAEAWARGGVEAERVERARCVGEKEQRERANFQALQRIREEGFRQRRETLGLPPGTTDPFFDTLQLPSGEEKLEAIEEPPELVAARRLAALQAERKEQEEGVAGAGEEQELPPLSEADLQAVLEDSRVRQAELQAEAGAGASPREENGNPNNTAAAPLSTTPVLPDSSTAMTCETLPRQSSEPGPVVCQAGSEQPAPVQSAASNVSFYDLDALD